MTLKELIEELKEIAEKYGDDLECIVGIESRHSLLEVELDYTSLNHYPDTDELKVSIVGVEQVV